MAVSQNGWPVIGRSEMDESTVCGVEFPHGVRAGDVATVLHYVARRFHAEVEPLKAGACWGWAVRPIRGTTSTISNHASGTALDFNAPAHPLGAVGTFRPAQVIAIEKILAACDGVVRWGGHYHDRKDEMHFEIVKSAPEVAHLAARLAAPPRRLTMEKLDGYALPVLKIGDDDADFPGYDRIGRVQRLLGVTDDGQYGPKTAAALKALGINDGRTIDLPVWRKLFGLSLIG